MKVLDSIQSADEFIPQRLTILLNLIDFIMDRALTAQDEIELFNETLSKLKILEPSLQSGIWCWEPTSRSWELAVSGNLNFTKLPSHLSIADDHQSSAESHNFQFLSAIEELFTPSSSCPAFESNPFSLQVSPISKRSGHDDFLVLWGNPGEKHLEELQYLTNQIGKALFRAKKTIQKIGKHKRSEAICSAVFHTSPMAMISISTDLRCLNWNPGAEKIFRIPTSKALGERVVLAQKEQQEVIEKYIYRSIKNKFPVQCEINCSNADSGKFPASIFIVPIIAPSQVITEVILMIRDESEITAAKQELHVPVQVCSILTQSRSLKDSWKDILSTIGGSLNFRSGSVWERSGSELQFELISRWSDEETDARSEINKRKLSPQEQKKVSLGNIFWQEGRNDIRTENFLFDDIRTRSDSIEVIIPLLFENEIHSILSFVSPIDVDKRHGQTEALKTIQEILGYTIAKEVMLQTVEQQKESIRQTKKMEALGVMAGGIAHDFNNLLTVILGNTELAMHDMNHHHGKWHLLDEIQQAGQRASSLTRRLLTFSRKRTSEPGCLNLPQVISDMLPMLRKVLGNHISLQTDFAPGCYPVFIDPVEFEQIVMNLTANSRDAMASKGQLHIELSNTELSLKDASLHLGIQPGSFLKMSFTDNGAGMSEEIKARIFEPFFTTKNVERGTGLGLATVHGIVKASGGFMNVISEIDQGTTFEIYFPRTSVGIAPTYVQEKVSSLKNGSETILVVEDDEVLGRLIKRILEVRGYKIRVFNHGKVALDYLKKHPKVIDLILTDVMMPEMSGEELIQEVKRIKMNIPILIMSGYNDSISLTEQNPTLTPILEKPFTGASLIQAINNTLQKEMASI